MFNRKSSYALNKKDPNAIVYMDANEAIIPSSLSAFPDLFECEND